jgi:hypothetical protein
MHAKIAKTELIKLVKERTISHMDSTGALGASGTKCAGTAIE